MPIELTFKCGGCPAEARGTGFLKREFRSFSGKGHGFGRSVMANTPEDLTPEGWVAYDPYTYATYCPECWASVLQPEDQSDAK